MYIDIPTLRESLNKRGVNQLFFSFKPNWRRRPHDSTVISSKDSIVGKGFRHSLHCIEALTWFADRHMEVMMMEIVPAHAFILRLIS